MSKKQKSSKKRFSNKKLKFNGKVRDQIEAPIRISEKEARELALKSSKIQKWLEEKEIKKIIFVKDKLINFVVGEK